MSLLVLGGGSSLLQITARRESGVFPLFWASAIYIRYIRFVT